MSLDVIDFTDLQKRGLLKEDKVEQAPDTIDFTAQKSSLGQNNPFDMLSSLAQAGESTASISNSTNSDVSLKLETIINKLEDTMYKIENLSSRIAAIEARLNPFIGL